MPSAGAVRTDAGMANDQVLTLEPAFADAALSGAARVRAALLELAGSANFPR